MIFSTKLRSKFKKNRVRYDLGTESKQDGGMSDPLLDAQHELIQRALQDHPVEKKNHFFFEFLSNSRHKSLKYHQIPDFLPGYSSAAAAFAVRISGGCAACGTTWLCD